MINKKNLLKVRKQGKISKPTFVVKESKFVAGVKKRWRTPRGKHSKVRQYHRGRPALPTPGYGSPKEVKGLHSSGLKPVMVSNVSDLKNINKEVEGTVISGRVGNRKRLDILKAATEAKIKLLNVKDLTKLSEKINKNLEERRKIRKTKTTVKETKEKEKVKIAEEKAKKEAEVKEEKSLDEKKKEEQKQVEKTITKRQ